MKVKLPVFTLRLNPVFKGEYFKQALPNEMVALRLKEATEEKQFVSGVLPYEGGYVGTILNVVRLYTNADNPYFIARGGDRVRLASLVRNDALYEADYAEVEAWPYDDTEEDLSAVIEVINTRLDALWQQRKSMEESLDLPDPIAEDTDIHAWVNKYAPIIVLDEKDSAALFTLSKKKERLSAVADILQRREYRDKADVEFKSALERELADQQKEYYLREELRMINEQLYGEGESETRELEHMIALCGAPDDVKDRLERELRKMSALQSSSPDSYVCRNYIENVCTLPWGIEKKEDTDIARARKVLEDAHYGLDSVKKRILEFLTVHKTGNNRGSILCLYGPPGVGKTSVVRSIAEALGRSYVRLSLGGMHDESEIRGHRRTYIASMPGKIISTIKKAGNVNPVFLLDEIDKLSNDYKGDPASALLEVLDPEQNKSFLDNYIDMPFDLSKVLFITTANDIGQIARPLLDRMELIEIEGYTDEEKKQILLRHLLPKQLKQHGLKEDAINLTDEAQCLLINGYTREAGVRALEQSVASLCRKVLVEAEEKPLTGPIMMDEKELVRHLGVAKYAHRKREKHDAVGVVNGLAWTSVGGEIMEMEAVLLPSKGNLRLTGNLGKVMRESAVTAHGFVKANADKWGIDAQLLDREIHIHATEGAVPKDGPSAGCALACLLVSVLTGRAIRADRALTGEVSLTGRVLAIGGLKEKSLGAMRDGITTIIVPEENRPDVDELPKSIKDNVTYIYAKRVEEVIDAMLVK